ncbi:MAG: transposase [Candidatus Competibacteraceae bacterium]|nr:transposase [Candidatus Competibacteraceae bacterium]
MFFLPTHSPELNPDEQVWNEVKHRQLGKQPIRSKLDLNRRIHSSLSFYRSKWQRFDPSFNSQILNMPLFKSPLHNNVCMDINWEDYIGGVLEPLAIAATGLLTFFMRKNKRDLWFSSGALFRVIASVSDCVLLVGRSCECRLSCRNAAQYSVQLDESAFKLGNGPCNSFRASIRGARIACAIADTRCEHNVR